jgi:hypothetical protein
MPDVTVYVSIGNSDDKLSQVEWSEFIVDTREAMKNWGANWFGEWHSGPTSRFQNACFGASFDHDHVGGLRENLKRVRVLYRQDSIAFAVVEHTEMI